LKHQVVTGSLCRSILDGASGSRSKLKGRGVGFGSRGDWLQQVTLRCIRGYLAISRGDGLGERNSEFEAFSRVYSMVLGAGHLTKN
jgi:hypothetical protein